MSYRIDISWSNIDDVQDGSSSMALGEVNGTIPETLNDIDYYDFTVYYGSSDWEHFAADLTYVKLWNSKNSDYVWYGRVASVIDGLSEEGVITKQIHCESEIAYLCDSVCDIPDVLKQMEDHHSYTPGDPVIADTFITALLDKHSQTVGAARRIYPPNCTWNSGGYFEIDEGESTGYPLSTITESLNIDTGSTFSVLKALRDKLGWDIWCEHTDDKTYLKVGLAGSREQGTGGVIKLRENMRSLTVERAPVSEGRVTRIIPLGGVGADGKRLNIASVNDYKRYLENTTLVAKYGNIDMVVLYDDLVDDGNMSAAQLTAAKNELKSRGRQRLALLTGGITAIKCRAVDLYEAGYSPSYTFKVGGLYAFDCSFLGLDEYNTSFRLYQKTTDLTEPYNPELTFILPEATYKTQVTNERMRIQQKLYAQAKAQADRMDNTSVKKTTSSAYDPTTANPGTVYYVDKGDGTGELMLDGTSYGGGGGGSGTTVENATVLVPENFHDFVIKEELILDIQPPNMLYYGRDTAIICVQGHYMLQVGYDTSGAASYDSEQGWVINGSKDTYNAVIANLDKFGSQLGTEEQGGFLITRRSSSATGGPIYPEEYSNLNARIVSISGYNQTNNRYSVSVDERRASTNAPTGNWWEEDMSWGTTTLYTHQQYLTAPDNNNANAVPNTLQLEALYLIPVTRPYQTTENYARTIPMQTPYGYADMQYPILVAAFRNKSTSELEYSLTNVQLTNANARYIMPLISNAEKCFALGLTKRTEPVPSNGGET